MKRNFKQGRTYDSNLQLVEKVMQFNALQLLFHGLEHILNNNNNSRIINKIAIAHDDLIFKYVNINLFKRVGNSILKNVSIVIYKRPILLTDDTEVDNVISTYHNTPVGGHLGINRLYRKLKYFYKFNKMKQKITAFVRSCNKCIQNKSFPTLQTKAVVTTTPAKAFDVLSIDTIGPFSLSEQGNRYAISIQCDLSKFLLLIPTPDKSAATIAKAVFKNCISIFGPSSCIKTDQGTEYKAVFDEICKFLNINHTCSTAYHPQTIGAVERSHRVLNEYLRSYCNKTQTDWDEWLPYFTLSFNTVPCELHGYTPFELVYGKNCSNIISIHNNKIDPVYNHNSYLGELKFKLQSAHAEANKAINKLKTLRTNSINSLVTESKLSIGDVVYLKIKNRQKLDAVNEGPYSIVAMDQCNATIEDIKGKKLHVHRDRLIKFNSSVMSN